MEEKSKKYYDLIKAAKKLFYKHGIKKVSIEDICKEANVSRMTYYKFFWNKMEIAKAVLDTIFDKGMEEYDKIAHSDMDMSEKINHLIKLKVKYAKDVSNDFIIDIHKNSDSELKEYLGKRISDGIQYSLNFITDSQRKGLIRKDINPTLYLAILSKLQEVIVDERVQQAYKSPEELVIEINKFFMYGISKER